MTRIRHHRISANFPGSQRGAVLYVALIMLILLALIGIVGMQVATLQERMSANYVAANVAFQNAEMQVRAREVEIITNVAFANENCAVPFDPKQWAEGLVAGTESVPSCVRATSASARANAAPWAVATPPKVFAISTGPRASAVTKEPWRRHRRLRPSIPSSSSPDRAPP